MGTKTSQETQSTRKQSNPTAKIGWTLFLNLAFFVIVQFFLTQYGRELKHGISFVLGKGDYTEYHDWASCQVIGNHIIRMDSEGQIQVSRFYPMDPMKYYQGEALKWVDLVELEFSQIEKDNRQRRLEEFPSGVPVDYEIWLQEKARRRFYPSKPSSIPNEYFLRLDEKYDR